MKEEKIHDFYLDDTEEQQISFLVFKVKKVRQQERDASTLMPRMLLETKYPTN